VTAARRERMNRLARVVAFIAGTFFVAVGTWAFFDPRSFYEQVATFPPYNLHLLHDVGAFQIGIGAALMLALVWKDALSVALGGAAVGGVMHAIAHFLDQDLGGRDSDPWLIAVLAGVLLLGLVAQRQRKRA
jgi:hypothetical protein